MTVRYKATRPDGTDFHTGTVHYEVGAVVTHPNPHRDDASGYLSVSTTPTDCTGMEWPCRLFEVDTVDEWEPGAADLPNKRTCHSLRVVRELPATDALGPQGAQVAALVERARALTVDELDRLYAARDAAWVAARYAARDAAWVAARDAAWDAAWVAAWDAAWVAARVAARDAAWVAARDAARDAVLAVLVRDLIGPDQFDTLTKPWREVVGATWDEVPA